MVHAIAAVLPVGALVASAPCRFEVATPCAEIACRTPSDRNGVVRFTDYNFFECPLSSKCPGSDCPCNAGQHAPSSTIFNNTQVFDINSVRSVCGTG